MEGWGWAVDVLYTVMLLYTGHCHVTAVGGGDLTVPAIPYLTVTTARAIVPELHYLTQTLSSAVSTVYCVIELQAR